MLDKEAERLAASSGYGSKLLPLPLYAGASFWLQVQVQVQVCCRFYCTMPAGLQPQGRRRNGMPCILLMKTPQALHLPCSASWILPYPSIRQ